MIIEIYFICSFIKYKKNDSFEDFESIQFLKLNFDSIMKF